MIKKLAWILVFVVLASFVSASSVHIFNFHYSDGEITLIDKRVEYSLKEILNITQDSEQLLKQSHQGIVNKEQAEEK